LSQIFWATFAFVKVKGSVETHHYYFRIVLQPTFLDRKLIPDMKKINWWRVAFFLLMVGMVALESCSLFKPKCNCPHF
jgi:hypothetical protein